ncbi:MAG: AAA family ATPase, partial [Prevotella sp.]|nr:AAA family ATPase [Prevotella sp.]
MQTLIVILGPTGVGKTDLCIDIARHLGCEIINCDSRQLFREIPIGTAAPTAGQQQLVRHYFVGTLSIDDY